MAHRRLFPWWRGVELVIMVGHITAAAIHTTAARIIGVAVDTIAIPTVGITTDQAPPQAGGATVPLGTAGTVAVPADGGAGRPPGVAARDRGAVPAAVQAPGAAEANCRAESARRFQFDRVG